MDAQLCHTCRGLDLEAEIFSQGSLFREHRLGPINQIRRRAGECVVCRLISSVAPSSIKVDYECSLGFSLRLQRGGGMVGTQVELGSKTIYFQEIRLYFKYPDGNWKEIVTLEPCPPQLPTCDQSIQADLENLIPWLSPRKVEPVLPLKLLKHWISACDDFHGQRCESPRWAAGITWPSRLRLIDVRRNCLVRAVEKTRYVALSYVWGEPSYPSRLWARLSAMFQKGHDSVRTRRADIGSMEAEGSLARLALPRTIKEAMALSRDLGETYLWVDALCVIQDDPSDLAIQIPQMDAIYSSATFTIIAASGTSAESGLARYTRQVEPEDISTYQISESLALIARRRFTETQFAMYSCNAWMERGWTFQEQLLSRRKIFLLEDRVYWQCEGDFWDEGCVAEPRRAGLTLNTGFDNPGHFAYRHSLRFNHSLSSTSNEPKVTMTPSALHNVLQDYGKRQFSSAHEYDVANALNGVFGRISALTGEMFHWGQPQSDFETSFLWRHPGMPKIKPRKCMLPMHNPQGETWQVKIPSWSWMAWQGGSWYVQSENYIFGFDIPDRKRDATLEWCRVDVGGHLLPLDRPGHQMPMTPLPLPPWKPATWARAPQGDNEISAANFKDSGRLRVTTSCATLTLRGQVNLHDDYIPIYQETILDADAKPAGFVYDITGASVSRGKRKRRCDFVLISETARVLEDLTDPSLRPHLGTDNTWYLLYVMLVEWDRKREVAYRRGLYGVSEADWMRANPEFRVVTLG